MIGVLCIHGFTGSPKEIEPLANFLREHTNWLVQTPVLPGHGEELKLKGVKFEQWLQHAEAELINLMKTCETVYICGFSMGGLIGSWLAAKYPVAKLVLLSAAAYYTNPKNFCKEIFQMITDFRSNSLNNNTTFQRYKRKLLSTPLMAYVQFRKLVRYVRPLIYKVSVPTLIIQGKNDPIVPEKSAHFLYENINARDKRLVMVDGADHLICYCDEQGKLFVEILYFLNGRNFTSSYYGHLRAGEKIAIDYI